jgi:hypothetical protein
MSSVFEEILTSTMGFIIAVVILSAVIGGGLYGYWLYVNHVTLENELMPIAEVVPYNGSYYLGIVNTGYEPIIIKDVYLNNSGVLSINSNPLTHNQWFFEQTSQLPTAVMVCSAMDPSVCEVVPVHGWTAVDPSSILGNNSGNSSQASGSNLWDNYLWHWVTAVVTTSQGQNTYSGLVEPYGSACYLVHINSNYLVGQLTSTNAYVTKDYGVGVYGCDAVGGCPPTPPGGPVSTSNYAGYWPVVSVASINSTTVGLTITLLQGTSFIRTPEYFVLYVLSEVNPEWPNVMCQGQHWESTIPNPNPPYTPLPAPNNCTFDMTWIHYPYQQGTACYNGGYIWCTLPNNVTYNITMNMNTQVPSKYYLIMIIYYPPGYGTVDFVWNITGTNINYPMWLYPPQPPANVTTPS